MAERKSLLEKNALTTLEAVMEFLGLEPDDPEVLDITKNNLERLINSASSYLEAMTGRKFARQDYVENHYGSGSQELCLNQYPIRAVEKILDVENQVILAPGSYSLSEMGEIGVVYRDRVGRCGTVSEHQHGRIYGVAQGEHQGSHLLLVVQNDRVGGIRRDGQPVEGVAHSLPVFVQGVNVALQPAPRSHGAVRLLGARMDAAQCPCHGQASYDDSQ